MTSLRYIRLSGSNVFYLPIFSLKAMPNPRNGGEGIYTTKQNFYT